MIKFNAFSFQYPQSTQKVLQNVHLEIPAGTLTLVTGASGSGKSTLLRCLNGLVPHFTGGVISGQVAVFGSDPIREGVEVMATKVGFVFQEPESQFVFDTVEDEIAFSLENMGVSRAEMEQRITEVLDVLQLSSLRHKKIGQISGGEQQKVAIASALVARPVVLVLDEPTSQLDPVSADEVLKFIIQLKTRLNLTVLISEHRLERLLPYTDLIVNLTPDGSVVYGSPQQVLPDMEQVPPIIAIAKRLGISPLPLTPETFPQTDLPTSYPAFTGQDYSAEDSHGHEILLEIRHLTASLGEHQVLKGIDLDIRSGEILVLMGPNGAGKTTLLRSLLKIIPSSGKISLGGQYLDDLSFPEIIQKIAYLPQNPNDLLFAESVIDELKITLKNHNRNPNGVNFTDFLEQFGLSDKGSQYPRDLSVGERQRTALAAVTVHNPDIIFLDEPTRGLDYQAKKQLSALFHTWREHGKAILLVTHDVEFAAQLADRVMIIEEGQPIFTGSPVIAFTRYTAYQTQTARLLPDSHLITPEKIFQTP
jgi:energy-coupling factor transport system ATP-binding protein